MHIWRRCMCAHTPIEMYLKLQIAKKSKPLASLGRWDSDSRFSLWKTIHLLRHFACEGNRFLLSARSLLSDPSAWRRWFKSLFNAVRSIFALHMFVSAAVCTCVDLCVFVNECGFRDIYPKKSIRVFCCRIKCSAANHRSLHVSCVEAT